MNKQSALGALVLVLTLALIGVTPSVVTAPARASTDPFFHYTGSRPLADFAPGTVLKTRTLPYHLSGVATPITAVQLLYRTTDAQGRPSANVTSVLIPLGANPAEAVSYQSAYDSLDPDDAPSRAIAGAGAGDNAGSSIFTFEAAMIAPLLAQRRTVIVSDVEGPNAAFAVGPVYGTATLDSIRAATRSAVTGLNAHTRIGLFGYSGGAIGTAWAAALAPSYAPEVNRRLVGAAEGGVLVDSARNLRYIDGSKRWAGVMIMAIIGAARAYDLDLSPYLSAYGARLMTDVAHAPITDVLGRYPRLQWKQMFRPRYQNPDSVTPLTTVMRKTNLAAAPTPTTPMFIGQAANGTSEGTDNAKPGIGAGDGVMVTADVRNLARQYCASGNRAVTYRQYDSLAHTDAVPAWAPEALLWLNNRFAKGPAPDTCSR